LPARLLAELSCEVILMTEPRLPWLRIYSNEGFDDFTQDVKSKIGSESLRRKILPFVIVSSVDDDEYFEVN
jgi:hypothetical protein